MLNLSIGEMVGICGLLVSVLMVFYVVKNMRKMTNLEEKWSPLVKQVMTNLSGKGVDAREVKQAERLLAGDLMESQFPEINMLLEYISPDTKEYLTNNPQVLPTLLERYAPIIQRFMGKRGSTERSRPFDV